MSCHTQKTACCLNSVGKHHGGEMKILKRICVDCGQCVSACPAAAGYEYTSGRSVDNIIQNGCINCGMCLQHCPIGAIEYADDTERFMRDLTRGMSISLLVAPAVCNSFADYRQLFGFLKKLGVQSFHNVLLRADITMWAYVELMRREKHAAFISSPCAAVAEYIRRHAPSLQPYLIPVYSPLVCTAVYLQKYRKVSDRMAFLSPCIAKRTEIQAASQGGYNITIGRLQQYIAAQGIDLSDYAAVDFDDMDEGNGLTLGVYGGLSECIAAHLPEGQFMKISGPDKVYTWLAAYEQAVRAGQKLPTLLEVYNCTAGCEGGTGVGDCQAASLEAIDANFLTGYRMVSETCFVEMELLFAKFRQNLNLADFIQGMAER